MGIWQDIERIVELVPLYLLSWSVLLFVTTARAIIPSYSWMSYPVREYNNFLQSLIAKQEFTERCVTVTIEATKQFISSINEVTITLLVIHFRSTLFDMLLGSWFPFSSLSSSFSDDSNSSPNDDDDDNSSPPPLTADPSVCTEDSEVVVQDRLVFDSVMGVIPEEMQRLWTEQAAARDLQLRRLQANGEQRHIPPVRYQEDEEDEGVFESGAVNSLPREYSPMVGAPTLDD